ncbi:MAG: hypothetical protein Q9227_003142 [Pyrenula ochraceoflavens]
MPPTAQEVELRDLYTMDRLRNLFSRKQQYEPLENGDAGTSEDTIQEEEDEISQTASVAGTEEKTFSWIEYGIFCLLGIAMLWAWNMFLAAAAYFQGRFESSEWIRDHFQSAQLSVSMVANMGSMLVLTKMQRNASYPKRILISLALNMVCFTLLALSTTISTSAGLYFGFMLLMVFFASLATGLIQNGLFSYVSSFGSRTEYTQAIMTGQAIAGVLPCVAQIASVLAATHGSQYEGSSSSALAFFLTATAVSVLAFIAFIYLLQHGGRDQRTATLPKSTDSLPTEGYYAATATESSNPSPRKSVGMWHLFKKLKFLALAVFFCFGITMVFPVFTTLVLSVNNNGLSAPSLFIPIAFLVWNLGDLTGRLVTLIPAVSLTHYPFALFVMALARLIFIPLYMLCNVRGHGAVVPSDTFYLVVVQFLFGLSNGYLGSSCMMGAGEWVAEEEKEAAGGFMGLCLVGGLSVGSLLSFFVGSV